MRSHIFCFVLLTIAAATAQRSCNSGVQCVPLQTSCSGLSNQLRAGATPQLTKLLQNLHCGFDDYQNPKVCCPPEFQNYPGEQPSRFGGGAPASNQFQPPSGYPNRPSQNQGASLLPDHTVCGIQSNDRIVGGTKTEIDEHPWMALLRYDKPRGWGFYCGGVLISSKYVMTAAHCVKGKDLPPNWRLSQVRLGEWNTSSTQDCTSRDDCALAPQDVGIAQVIAHEDYNANDDNQHNDIALLRLARDVQYTDFVKPICLPTSNVLRAATFEDYTMEVAGWGKTENRSESDVKLKVRVPVVTRSECQRVFQRANRNIINKQLCAGGVADHDSCRGDSGGPLMGRQPRADNWIAVGVVSYGPSPCGTKGWPGVYTRVGAYVDWILSKLEP